MANVFENLPATKSIKQMIDTPITVEGQVHSFGDFIESEIISDFPTYSHRMRSTFIKASQMIDTYLKSISDKLKELETQLDTNYNNLSTEKRQEITTFIGDRKSEIAEYIKLRQEEIKKFIDTKNQEFTNHIATKNNEMVQKFTAYDKWYREKEGTINSKLSEIIEKLSRVDSVLQGVEATDDKLGLVTLNKVKSLISDNVPVAKENVQGKISINEIIKLIKTTAPNINIANQEQLSNLILSDHVAPDDNALLLAKDFIFFYKSLFDYSRFVFQTGQPIDVYLGDIFIGYGEKNALNFYKVIKQDKITIPTTEHCKRLELGATETFEEIKKKIFIG